MTEEFTGGMDSNIDIQGGQESGEKVKEADVQKIRENEQKARKVAGQIKSTKQKNSNISNFLSFLLKKLNNNDLINYLYEVFFKVKNPKNNTTYLRKDINNMVIAGLFVPFFIEETKKFNLWEYYKKLLNTNEQINYGNYVSYLKKLSSTYHDNVPLNKENFLVLIVKIILHFQILSKNELGEDTNYEKKLYLKLQKNLYG